MIKNPGTKTIIATRTSVISAAKVLFSFPLKIVLKIHRYTGPKMTARDTAKIRGVRKGRKMRTARIAIAKRRPVKKY